MVRDVYLAWCEDIPSDALQDPTFAPQERSEPPRSTRYWNDGSDHTPYGRASPIQRPESTSSRDEDDTDYESSSGMDGSLGGTPPRRATDLPIPKRQRLCLSLDEMEPESPTNSRSILSWRGNVEGTPSELGSSTS